MARLTVDFETDALAREATQRIAAQTKCLLDAPERSAEPTVGRDVLELLDSRYSQGPIVAVERRFPVIEFTGRGEGESGRMVAGIRWL